MKRLTSLSAWTDLCTKLGSRISPHYYYGELQNQYTDPRRAYHNLKHIEHCLIELAQVQHLLADPDAAAFALWLHDYFYFTREPDVLNVTKSAQAAFRMSQQMGFPMDFTLSVVQHINATKHTDTVTDQDSQYVADIDLAILGQPEDIFDRYEEAIRVEYSWVPEDTFSSERKNILKRISGSPQIYYTAFFQEKYEQMARRNLNRSIDKLEMVQHS